MFFDRKKKDLNGMLDEILETREEDLYRVLNVKQTESSRKKKSDNLLKWYISNTGTDLKKTKLSDEEMNALKETWKDIWDLGVIHPEWYQVYAKQTGQFDPNYIGSDIHNYYVEWKKIDFDYLRGFVDKNYLDSLFPNIKHPPTLVRKIHGMYFDADFKPISQADAVDIIYQNRFKGSVSKISNRSWGGSGVTFLNESSTKHDIIKALNVSRDVHVESVIRQHPDMAKMNESSINTIRIITIMLNNESIPLSACVRIGNTGSKVDNFSSGGVGCGVRPDGTLNDFGITQKGERMDVHPNGFIFREGKVPYFDRALEAVKSLHYRVPIFGVANWDICIDESGDPLLIEYNIGGGGIDIHQYNNGPLYGEHREQIISQVFDGFGFRDATLDFNYLKYIDRVEITKGSSLISDLTVPERISDKPVTAIVNEAFAGRKKLHSVTFEGDLDRIGFCAFFRCSNLKKVIFKGNVKVIGRSAFNECEKLKEIRLPDGLTKIDALAFRKCISLKELRIPDSVQEIADDAFLESSITLLCGKDSYACGYAKRKSIPYKTIS